MEGEKPEANMTFIALQVQIGAVVVVVTLPIARILSAKNACAWVSMVFT